MNPQPSVTVICATFNARDATRLTFASFRRYTPEPCIVLVADNGSTDGTLENLRAISWLTVIPLQNRLAKRPADMERGRQVISLPSACLDAYEGTLGAHNRMLSASRCTNRRLLPPASEEHLVLTHHGVTLDWLAEQVRTPFFLTMDSDVEFLASGWLSEMLDLMERENLVALGEYTPGLGAYRRRLMPHLLVLRTAAFRTLRVSFQGFVRIEDPGEARRWLARPNKIELDPKELLDYTTASFYDTGAALFESLERIHAHWASLPPAIMLKFRHIGHMSWGSSTSELISERNLSADRSSRLAYVRERLSLYEKPCQNMFTSDQINGEV